jgi:V8-like Glu-specific endopeptidase
VEVIPGAHGPLEPFGAKLVATGRLRASSAWQSSGSQALDYGAILLDAPFTSSSGAAPAMHGIAIKTDAELLSANVLLSGYPGDKLFGTQWMDDDPISAVLSDRLRYNLDTFGGQSGSAVIPVGETAAVGIHNYGGCSNKCTRITAAVKADLDAWLAESGSP